MDDPTRQIIASILTAAYGANHPEPLSEEGIIEIYHRFVKLLGPAQGDTRETDEDLFTRL